MLQKGLSNLGLLATLLLVAGPAQADPTVFMVDSPAQQFSANGDLPTNCTLGDAIEASNADAAVDTCSHPNLGTGGPFEIVIPAGLGPLVLRGSIPATSGRVGHPVIRANVTILGGGNAIERDTSFACPDPVGGEFRHFEVARGARLVLEDVALHNGCAPVSGAVHNAGQLVLQGVLLSGNETFNGDGGAVGNFGGNAEIVDSTLADNLASADGGAIVNRSSGVLVLKRSTLTRNTAGAGGGLQNVLASATLLNATLSGNSATEGGAISNAGDGSLTLLNSTLAANTANQGAGIYNRKGTMSFANSILNDPCFFRELPGNTDAGHNLERWNTCGLNAPTSMVSQPTGLALLADNGGPTPTHAIVAGGPAIDAADDATCAMAGVDASDQRGLARPDGDPTSAASCDIGAVEYMDCDGNDIDDGSEIAADPALDVGGNGVLDACEDQPPVADAGPDQVLECSSDAGAPVTLDGSGSSDPEGAPLTYAWSGPCRSETGVSASVVMPLGSALVSLEVADPAANTAADALMVTVEDNTAPTASAAVERVAMNGDWDDVRIQASCSDLCDPSVTLEALFDGATVADGDVVQVQGFVDASAAPLLTVRCVDASGHSAEATAPAPARDPVVEEPEDDRWSRWQEIKRRWRERFERWWDRLERVRAKLRRRSHSHWRGWGWR
ncbi:MAG: choice-of-anchor Q domain-containing protein [Myxococcota bacterium]